METLSDHESLLKELEETRMRLQEAEYTLDALRSGKADALVIYEPQGEKVVVLERLQALADSIVEHAVGGLILIDGRGRILKASPAAADWAGPHLEGADFDEAFHLVIPENPDFPETISERDVAAPFSIRDVLGGKSFFATETALTRKDGVTFNLLLGAKPLASPAGGSDGAVVSLIDITARKRAEMQFQVRTRQLRYQFELTRAITDSAAEALFLMDENGKVVLMNPAAESMLGVDSEELIGKPFHAAVHPQHAGVESLECPLGRAFGQPVAVRNLEDVFRKKDGTAVPVHFSSSRVSSHGKKSDSSGTGGIVLLAVDNTRRKEAEAALQVTEEKLRQSQKLEAIGRLAGGIAHDFNNLLTAINGYADLGLAMADADTQQSEYFKVILKCGERAAALTSHLLAYSRRQVLAAKLVDLNDLVRDSANILRQVLAEGITLILEPLETPCPVRVDSSRIEQVIISLAVNAREAMPQGGTLLLKTSILQVEDSHPGELSGPFMDEGMKPGRYAVLTVADNGPGMDEAVLSHLFEPFFTTKKDSGGMGLGLSMAYGIVKQSGGHIQAISEPGQGATIEIFLPLVERGPVRRKPRPDMMEYRGSETVLLVEDEEAVLGFTTRVLTEKGYRVLQARSAQQALKMVGETSEEIHLLIADVILGDKAGPELACELVALRPRLNLLFISGYADDGNAEGGVKEDGSRFLQKPFGIKDLLRAVRQALGPRAKSD